LPTKPEVAVTIPEALMFVAFSEVTVETPEELMLPVKFPVTLPVKAPTNPSEEVVIPVTTTPDALVSNEGELTSPVKFPVTLPVSAPTNVVAVTIPEEFTLPTFRFVRVPTEVSEELTTPDPRVVEERTSVLLTL